MFVRHALALLFVCWCSLARAQDGAAEPAPAKKPQPMDGFALGVKFGWAHVSSGEVDNPTYIKGADQLPEMQLEQYGLVSARGCDPLDRRCRTAARSGYFVALPIQLGGTGVGFRVEPTIGWGDGFSAYGGYAGPTFEFHLAEPFYLGFGFGLKAAYVLPEHWQYAVDVFGRIPVWATLYLSDGLALVGEFAFGAGASGYVSELRNVYNPVDRALIGHRRDITFGFVRTWDVSIGLRFP